MIATVRCPGCAASLEVSVARAGDESWCKLCGSPLDSTKFEAKTEPVADARPGGLRRSARRDVEPPSRLPLVIVGGLLAVAAGGVAWFGVGGTPKKKSSLVPTAEELAAAPRAEPESAASKQRPGEGFEIGAFGGTADAPGTGPTGTLLRLLSATKTGGTGKPGAKVRFATVGLRREFGGPTDVLVLRLDGRTIELPLAACLDESDELTVANWPANAAGKASVWAVRRKTGAEGTTSERISNVLAVEF